jgi:aryl-alcohol dehydrogenase-like predicted oxidoreductase
MIPKTEFGRTGHLSTRAIFGAAAFMSVSQAEADATMELITERGINHIDTAADYGDSEKRLGPWMRRDRRLFFLATKTAGRTYDSARDSFHRSLERLQTDHVDLLQLHLLVDESDWQTAMSEDGALRYLTEARDEGLTRFIGVTGHGLRTPGMHMRSLDRFPFDSVLLPWNYPLFLNRSYRSEFESLQARCIESSVAMQTIKSIARGPWGDKEPSRAVWYEPLEAQEDIDRAVAWVLSHENVFLNTAGDIDLLPRVLDAVERFDRAPRAAEMDAMMKAREIVPLFTE